MSVIELPITRPPEGGSLDPEVALILLRRFFKRGDVLLDPFGEPPVFEMVGKELGIKIVSTDIRRGVDVRDLPFDDNEFDGVVAHPPYWDARKYSNNPRDLSNAKTYEEFLKGMEDALKEIRRVMKNNKTLILITGDRRKGGRLYPIHADLIMIARKIGFKIQDILILRGILHKIRSGGYCKPHSKPSLLGHIYCLVFKKKPIQKRLVE